MYQPFKDLPKILREKNVRVRFPRGYQEWKKRFESAYAETKDVKKSLDKIQQN